VSYVSYAVTAAALTEASAARTAASIADIHRARAEARARAARRGNAAASARAHVLGDTVTDLRQRLADAQAVIDELIEENRELRADAGRMAAWIEENA
jgi:hypothetical protein